MKNRDIVLSLDIVLDPEMLKLYDFQSKSKNSAKAFTEERSKDLRISVTCELLYHPTTAYPTSGVPEVGIYGIMNSLFLRLV